MVNKLDKASEKFGGTGEQKEETKARRGSDRLTPMWRNMKIFRITENEVSQLSLLNDLSSFFFSCGSFVAAIYIEAWMFLPTGEMCSNVKRCSAIAAGVFFVAGGVMLWKRTGVMGIIKSESSSEKIS